MGKQASRASSQKKGSGARIRQLLKKGWLVERIVKAIHREFPGSKATKADVAWNRWAMKRKPKARKGAAS